MSKIRALTLEEIKNMDGKTVFTVPVVKDDCEEVAPSFDISWQGLGFHVVNVEKEKLIDEKGYFWRFNDINPTDDCGLIAFKEKVTEKEAIEAWEEMKSSGMVK